MIVNPKARSVRKDPAIGARLGAILGDRGEVYAPASPSALLDTARALAADGVRQVALLGGDGTGHRVATAIFDAWPEELPELMWLHGGTMNTVSRSMGNRGRPEGQLRAWLAEAEGGPSLPRTTRWPLHVSALGRDSTPLPREIGFLFGVGIVARFIAAYEQGGEPSPIKAAWTLARAVGSSLTGGAFAEAFFRGIPAEVSTDGAPWPRRAWRILTIGAVDEIGLGFRPTPGVLTHPGCLHAFAAASSPVRFALDLAPLYFGRPTGDPLTAEHIGKRVTLRAEEPLTYNLDGDLFEVGTEIEVSTDRGLRFVLADPRAVDRMAPG